MNCGNPNINQFGGDLPSSAAEEQLIFWLSVRSFGMADATLTSSSAEAHLIIISITFCVFEEKNQTGFDYYRRRYCPPSFLQHVKNLFLFLFLNRCAARHDSYMTIDHIVLNAMM